jgi:predicted regulator of Ras-like GTPase activity (Roadblock/LC7/MglB family)
MDAKEALSELVELSSQVRTAVVLDDAGAVLAATSDGGEAAERLARVAVELAEAARELHGGESDVTRVEVDLAEGAVFLVRGKGLTVAATTGPEPTAGLVVYDLRTCLDRIDERPRRRRSAKAKEAE